MLKFLVYFNNLDGREQVAGHDREGYGFEPQGDGGEQESDWVSE